MRLPVRRDEHSELSAPSGAIFLTSERRKLSYVDIKKLATSLSTSATEREASALCQVEPMTIMHFVKIAFNLGQDELSANEVMKHLVPII